MKIPCSNRIGFALFFLIIFLSSHAFVQAVELTLSEPEAIPITFDDIEWGFDLDAGAGGSFHLLVGEHDREAIYYGNRMEETWIIEKVTRSYFDSTGNYSLGMWGNIAVAMFYNPPTDSLWWGSNIDGWDMTELMYNFPAEFIDLTILNGDLHVALIRTDSPPFVWYIYTTDNGWRWETIAMTSDTSNNISIAIDEYGHTHFAWNDEDSQTVQYAYRNGPEDYVIETVQTVVDCQGLDMVIVSPDIVYLGILDSSEDKLWAMTRTDGLWNQDLVADDLNLHTASMAVAAEEGSNTRNVYFVYSAGGTPSLNYAYWDNGWINQRIPGTEQFIHISQVAAAWDAEKKRVGMAFTGSDISPMNFMVGWTEVPQADISLDLWMNDGVYSGGDILWLSLEAVNLGSAQSVDLYIILDVAGTYWFYPTWTTDLDHFSADFDDLETLNYTIIDPIILPVPLPSGCPFTFYAAAFESGTLDAATLVSNVDSVSFSFL